MVFNDFAQAAEMIKSYFTARLGFAGRFHIAEDKIYFNTAGQPPITQIIIYPAIGPVRAQFVKHPIFKSLPKKFRTGCEFPPLGQAVNDPHIRKIKLRRFYDAAFGSFPPSLKESAQHGVNQYLKILPHGGTGDTAFPCNRGIIDEFSVGKSGHGEKTGKCRKISYQRLGGNLFFQVVVDIRADKMLIRRPQIMPRKITVIDHPDKVKISTDFLTDKPE